MRFFERVGTHFLFGRPDSGAESVENWAALWMGRRKEGQVRVMRAEGTRLKSQRKGDSDGKPPYRHRRFGGMDWPRISAQG
jgi:hypothetical protein